MPVFQFILQFFFFADILKLGPFSKELVRSITFHVFCMGIASLGNGNHHCSVGY